MVRQCTPFALPAARTPSGSVAPNAAASMPSVTSRRVVMESTSLSCPHYKQWGFEWNARYHLGVPLPWQNRQVGAEESSVRTRLYSKLALAVLAAVPVAALARHSFAV